MYMYCNVSTTDGREHSVQLFTDVTGGAYTIPRLSFDVKTLRFIYVEWLAKDLKKTIKWNFTESDSMFFHTAWLDSPTRLSYDNSGMAEDSFLWFASNKVSRRMMLAGPRLTPPEYRATPPRTEQEVQSCA